MKTLQQEDTATLVRTMCGFMGDTTMAKGQCFKDLTIAITEISRELARRGWYEDKLLLAELVKLVERCFQLEAIFPQQAGMMRALTIDARQAIAKSVQTEKFAD